MSSAAAPQRPHRLALRCFSAYLHWYVPRHFHALRVSNPARFPDFSAPSPAPVVVLLNHASWWDPLTCILLSRALASRADHYAPIDAEALERYGLLRRMGLFPVKQTSLRGAAQFLSAGRQILSRPCSALWITPQGRFNDVRQRPPALRPGIATLLKHIQPQLSRTVVVPIAIEYLFWNERLPEILVNCGSPLRLSTLDCENRPALTAQLATALAATQDELAALACSRDAAPFTTLLTGRAGVSAIYDAWRLLRSFFGGAGYPRAHGEAPRP